LTPASRAIQVAGEKVERLRGTPSLSRDEALGLFLVGFVSTSLTPLFGIKALSWAVIGVSAAFAVPAVLFYLYAAGGMERGPLKTGNGPASGEA